MHGAAAGWDDEVMSDLPQPVEELTAEAEPEPAPADPVDDCSEASFPASDPPSWWGGH
jgi:hypothetical protein